VAVNCCVAFTLIVGAAGVTAIDVSAGTVSKVDPVTLPCVAEIVDEPEFTAVAEPLLLIVATDVVPELHVTCPVIVSVPPPT
jgi:hypothetical protein